MITGFAVLGVEEPFAIGEMERFLCRSCVVIFFYMRRLWLKRVGYVPRVSQHDALETTPPRICCCGCAVVRWCGALRQTSVYLVLIARSLFSHTSSLSCISLLYTTIHAGSCWCHLLLQQNLLLLGHSKVSSAGQGKRTSPESWRCRCSSPTP
jgi:hypothetical protein